MSALIVMHFDADFAKQIANARKMEMERRDREGMN